MHLNSHLLQYQNRINQILEKRLPDLNSEPQQLHQAMTYAVLNGGKRIRPLLVYTTGETLNTPLEILDDIACAIELIHSYSLVHDDLPAMDNDDLRRGKPTCHKAFDEATAILVGDALQTLAFQVLADNSANHLPAEIRLQLVHTLANASGSTGMAGGQALDLQATGKTLNLAQLEQIHNLKTGALIHASIYTTALASQCEPLIFKALNQFAKLIGLAFQIQDDILDIESSTTVLGKQQGADIAQNKATYPAIAGIPAAKIKLADLYQQAQAQLDSFAPHQNALADLINHISHRNY